MKLIEMLDPESDFVISQVKKLAPPLVTLLSAESEIQYVSLRNINLIVQKRYHAVISYIYSLFGNLLIPEFPDDLIIM